MDQQVYCWHLLRAKCCHPSMHSSACGVAWQAHTPDPFPRAYARIFLVQTVHMCSALVEALGTGRAMPAMRWLLLQSVAAGSCGDACCDRAPPRICSSCAADGQHRRLARGRRSLPGRGSGSQQGLQPVLARGRPWHQLHPGHLQHELVRLCLGLQSVNSGQGSICASISSL